MDGATAAALAVSLTSMGGMVLAYRKAPSEARRNDVDAADIIIKSGDGRIKSMMEFVEFSNEQLARAHAEIRNLRSEVREKDGLIEEQGKLINQCRVLRERDASRIHDLEEHVAALERRKGDWRREAPGGILPPSS